MKYLALIYSDPAARPLPGTQEFGKLMTGYQTANEVYRKDGVYLAGEALQSTATATTVRIRNGKVETTDGPFAETKEQLGGFYMIDCANLDEAIKYASMIPTADHGSIEVRPIQEIDWASMAKPG
ncbi:MAG: YciI family protein [Beijerinckiaceae bacterium]